MHSTVSVLFAAFAAGAFALPLQPPAAFTAALVPMPMALVPTPPPPVLLPLPLPLQSTVDSAPLLMDHAIQHRRPLPLHSTVVSALL